jgi:hypothetical protein
LTTGDVLLYTLSMKVNGRIKSSGRLIAKVYASPRYQGKRVIIIHGKVFPSPSGVSGFRKLQSLVRRYPGETPTIVYVPKADALILAA